MGWLLGNIFIGTMILGAVSGVLGVFGIFKEQSLLGDVISHAAFPGITIAFWLTFSKNLSTLMIGGSITGLLGAVSVFLITTYSSLKKDTALGIILSVFFGVGLVILTHIQKLLVSKQSILNKFLFGNAATLLPEDTYLIAGIGLLVILVILLFFKELILISFDPLYANVIGYSIIRWNILLTVLQVITIMIGLQAVGIILMSTMLIAPAVASRQWTYNASKMTCLSAFFGALASSIGTIVSGSIGRLPTGPVIIIVLSILVVFSLLFAPHRGLFWHYKKRDVTS